MFIIVSEIYSDGTVYVYTYLYRDVLEDVVLECVLPNMCVQPTPVGLEIKDEVLVLI